MAIGASVNVYYMDGVVDGRVEALLDNWNCTIYKMPRTSLKKVENLSVITTPGVYFLFGKDDETGKDFVYVGEADNVQKRLLQIHTFENDGTYWVEAVICVTPDGTLNKAYIKYLENKFYIMATKAKRYIIKNANTPTQSPLKNKKDKDKMEVFIANVKLVMPALSYQVFEATPSNNTKKTSADDYLYFSRNKGKGGEAVGKVEADGFWVLKGSYIYPKLANYIPNAIKMLRVKYAKDIDKNSVLQQDISFGSPSYAATFVCGKNSNGLIEWKNKAGVSLKILDSIEDANKKSNTVKLDATKDDILYLASNKASATGKVSDKEFIVYKGSTMCQIERKSCGKAIHRMRNKLIESSDVKNYQFVSDVIFKSPSIAAACLVGGESNGLLLWREASGKTLKEKMKMD